MDGTDYILALVNSYQISRGGARVVIKVKLFRKSAFGGSHYTLQNAKDLKDKYLKKSFEHRLFQIGAEFALVR